MGLHENKLFFENIYLLFIYLKIVLPFKTHLVTVHYVLIQHSVRISNLFFVVGHILKLMFSRTAR